MRVKYNRVSTLAQSGNRFSVDTVTYDLVLFDKVSGSVPFKERPRANQLVKLVEDGKVKEVNFEELSRIGRNVGDTITVCEWFDSKGVNLIIKNLGLESRPNGKANPIWRVVCATMSSLYAMELENIRERTAAGRVIFLKNGGVLGRPVGTNEPEKDFIKKKKSVNIIRSLKKGMSIRETAKVNSTSTRTVLKTKRIASKHRIL